MKEFGTNIPMDISVTVKPYAFDVGMPLADIGPQHIPYIRDKVTTTRQSISSRGLQVSYIGAGTGRTLVTSSVPRGVPHGSDYLQANSVPSRIKVLQGYLIIGFAVPSPEGTMVELGALDDHGDFRPFMHQVMEMDEGIRVEAGDVLEVPINTLYRLEYTQELVAVVDSDSEPCVLARLVGQILDAHGKPHPEHISSRVQQVRSKGRREGLSSYLQAQTHHLQAWAKEFK